MRVHEYAKQFNVSSKEVLQVLEENNISVKSHMSVLGDDVILMLDKNFKNEQGSKIEDVNNTEKETTNETDDLFKYDDYLEVNRPKITKKKKGSNQKKIKNEKSDRIANVPVKEDAEANIVYYSEDLTVGELAERLGKSTGEIVKQLLMLGMMATVNQTLDRETVELVAEEAGFEVKDKIFTDVIEFEKIVLEDSEEDLEKRPPVVTIMGHVDHGKTTLLDAIRNSRVVTGEAGGITQHIGAYQVNHNGNVITFLDTPGHAAFTSMRARGAQVTDICVLVVAADDGVMPQTKEAIDHAKAAGVPIIVAVNKMDKPTANPDRVKEQLTQHEILPEEWGGDVPCMPISALTGEGIQELLEMVMLVADMKELKANPDRAAKGTVIEARLDKGRGPIATILVQNGTLNIGDSIVAGTTVGRVRAMTNDRGELVKSAGPSVPVEITGLDDVPTGGDIFNAVSDERLGRQLVEQRRSQQKEERFNAQTKVTLDNLFDQMQEGQMKELQIIVKADVQGSFEAVKQSLEKLSNDEVRVRVIHGGVGAISESDVMLASASNAIIIGFNVRPDPVAEENAKRDGIDLHLYRIIYEAIEDVQAAMKGMLAPKYRELFYGRAECRQVYKISNVGIVMGSYVTDGKIVRNSLVRIVRDGIIIADDKIASLRRFKDDVKEVAEGYECGVTLEHFNDVKEGDVFESYIMEEYRED